MNLDDLKGAWRSEEAALRHGPKDGELMERVRTQATDLDRAVRRRDRREIAVALVVTVFFLSQFGGASGLTRAGILLWLAAGTLVVVMLRRARRPGLESDPTAPLLVALRQERDRVAAQIRLLTTVLWWYILPLALAPVLIFAGAVDSWLATAVYGVAVAALGALVYGLNQRAVDNDLRPHHAEIERMLAQMEGR